MRIFALSDLHVDYAANAEWVRGLSTADYTDDVLILAGDISDSKDRLQRCLTGLCSKFGAVVFVPGNHELWVARDQTDQSSWGKFHDVCEVATACGAHTRPYSRDGVRLVPLFSWYDYSFGQPGEKLTNAWMDFHACRWPTGWTEDTITAHFIALNERWIIPSDDHVISFSHFVPRIDVMPSYIPQSQRYLYPVLGSDLLEKQLRRLGPRVHVYGHSHVNQNITIDGINYINNAFGYPSEGRISSKSLLCIHDTSTRQQ